MGRNLGSYFLELLITIAGLILVSFMILKLLPGSPFDDETSLNPVIQKRLEQDWALHRSWINQLWMYSKTIASGNFGESMIQQGLSVRSILQEGFASTFKLDLLALVFIFFGGFFLASLLVLGNSLFIKSMVEILVLAFISLPSLFLGPLLIYFFAIYLDLLPAARLNLPTSYILPVIALSLRPMAYLARLLSRTWLANLNQDYMQLALAKGLSYRQAVLKHALRNSLIPVVNYSGPLIVSLISGSFLVEILFVIPGLGTSFVRSLENRDYPIVIGLTLFFGIILVFVSLILDLVNQKLDPRWKK